MADKKTVTAVPHTERPATIDYGLVALVAGVLAAAVALFVLR